jgi:TolB protein
MKIEGLIIVWFVSFMLVSCTPEIKVASTETAIPTSAIGSMTSEWKAYTSDTFLVTLKYPADWDTHHEGYDVYSGQDGFFQLSATSIATPTAKEWCELEVQHNPDKTGFYRYGTKPAMEVLKVDTQPACLVLPSDDQPESQRGYSLLVVEYPTLEEGRTRLLFFMADKNHIHALMDTLKFVR